MAAKPIDPKEIYIVREVFCCGEGHCPGITFTHWESGEACPMNHEDNASNEDVHLYWRMVLVPLYRSNPDRSKDQYSESNGDYWEWASKREHENKWAQFPIAPKSMKEGTRIEPAKQETEQPKEEVTPAPKPKRQGPRRSKRRG